MFSKYDYLALPLRSAVGVQFPDPDESFRPVTAFLPAKCKKCASSILLLGEDIQDPSVETGRDMGSEKFYHTHLQGRCEQCNSFLEADADFEVYADSWSVSNVESDDVNTLAIPGLDDLVTSVRELKEPPSDY